MVSINSDYNFSHFNQYCHYNNNPSTMLMNDSQQQPSEDNDNEFLPNRSNSYESMIKDHQQRRSLMLSDRLILPSSNSNEPEPHFLQGNFSQQEGGMLQAESEAERSHSAQRDIEQEGENEFLLNEDSLVASIKEAMKSNQSKNQSNLSQQKHFIDGLPSNEEPFPSHSVNERHIGSDQKSEEREQYEAQHHFSNISANIYAMDSNIDSKHQSEQQQQQMSLNRNSVESDPFLNVGSQHENSNDNHQNFPESSTLQKHQLPFKSSEEPNELQQEQNLNNNTQNNFLAQESQERELQSGSKLPSVQKSRSQIEGLYSDLQSKSQPKEIKEESQGIKYQKEAVGDQNSLSNLMKQNYFEKEYQQFTQKVESQQIIGSNSIEESEVKTFRKQAQQSLNDMSRHSFQKQKSGLQKNKEEVKQPSNESIDHILMTYESKSNIESAAHHQKEESIINNMNDVSKSRNNPSQLQSQRSSNKAIYFEEQRSVEDILEQSDKIEKQHASHLKELDLNHSEQHQKPSSHHQNEYYNEFNQQQNEGHFDLNNESQEERVDEPLQSNLEMKDSVKKSRQSEQSFNKSHKKDLSMPVIDHSQHSIPQRDNDPYQIQSSKIQSKQSSIVEKSPRNFSDLHLPEIEVKSKKSSEISKKSHISKKTPSIRMENQSKISERQSKLDAYSKKNSSKLEKNVREKLASYSEGINMESFSQKSQIYREVQVGSTTFDSKSIILKKKQQSAKEIFNTVPQEINLINSTEPMPVCNKQINEKLKNETMVDSVPKQPQILLRSPTKQRQDQIQRIRALKQAQRKRLQRQLEKVKKQLQEINIREKNMDRIYEQKQKIEAKERQNLTNSRENDFTNKITRHHRENEALMNIIKQHRKSKEVTEQKTDNNQDNITKNLVELNKIRQEAEEKLKEKKRLDILDRMKKNEMRKINEQKLIKANNQYIQQFRSVDNPVLSPPPAHIQSKDKAGPNKKPAKDQTNNSKITRFIQQDKKKFNAYEEKLD